MGKLLLVAHFFVAIAAIYRAIVLRLKRHLGLFATLCTNGCMHYSVSASGLLALITAFFAAKGLILKPFLSKKFLLTGGEHKLFATVFAYQCLVLVHCDLLTLKIKFAPDGFEPSPLKKQRSALSYRAFPNQNQLPPSVFMQNFA